MGKGFDGRLSGVVTKPKEAKQVDVKRQKEQTSNVHIRFMEKKGGGDWKGKLRRKYVNSYTLYLTTTLKKKVEYTTQLKEVVHC